MAYFRLISVLLLLIVLVNTTVPAQDDPYKFSFAPDVWYNDVDGIRLGLRTFGEVEGSFKDGPHRLDAGIWVSTWFPDLPVSYYLSFTEPIASITDFGNEGSIQLVSSIRTGYSKHRLQFNKRWQPGFNEYDYKELSVYFSQNKMFEPEYRPFTQLWQTNWTSIIGIQFLLSSEQEGNRFEGIFHLKQNINSESGAFSLGTIELKQKVELNKSFGLRLRVFSGIGSDDVTSEYRFFSSLNSPQSWLNNGVSRAKGTIPQPWLQARSFHLGGGANLRGYLNQDINALVAGNSPLFTSILSGNIELEFPNPLGKALSKVPYVGDVSDLRSYTFFDMGRGNFLNPTKTSGDLVTDTPILADAGLGLQLSVNIPDYLGKDRGIFIRYEIPFWLSQVDTEASNFFISSTNRGRSNFFFLVMKILVINCGSSSIKYQLINTDNRDTLCKGLVERIGAVTSIIKQEFKGEKPVKKSMAIDNHAVALKVIMESLVEADNNYLHSLDEIEAVGHRVAHGGEIFKDSVLIDEDVEDAIEQAYDIAPLHNPPNLQGIRAAKQHLPKVPHVAVFDTAFHHSIPSHAYLYAIPNRLYRRYKIRRYGFHGTSHYYVSRQYFKLSGKEKEGSRIITCHLGNGASITAIKDGYSYDTSMGFSPLEGLVMGTRSGDLDPSILFYLIEKEELSLANVHALLNKHSGFTWA